MRNSGSWFSVLINNNNNNNNSNNKNSKAEFVLGIPVIFKPLKVMIVGEKLLLNANR